MGGRSSAQPQSAPPTRTEPKSATVRAAHFVNPISLTSSAPPLAGGTEGLPWRRSARIRILGPYGRRMWIGELLRTSRPAGWPIAAGIFRIGMAYGGAAESRITVALTAALTLPFCLFLFG